jgi:hypothetical protein
MWANRFETAVQRGRALCKGAVSRTCRTATLATFAFQPLERKSPSRAQGGDAPDDVVSAGGTVVVTPKPVWSYNTLEGCALARWRAEQIEEAPIAVRQYHYGSWALEAREAATHEGGVRCGSRSR